MFFCGYITEFLIILCSSVFFRGNVICGIPLVQTTVHNTEYEEGQEADDKEGQREEQWCGKCEVAGDGGRDTEGCGCSETCHCQLDAHGEGEFMPRKPAYHRLRDGDARHLIAYAKDGKAEGGDCYRCGKGEVKSEERKVDDGCWRESGCDGIVLDEGAEDHQRARQDARKADAHLVEDQS